MTKEERDAVIADLENDIELKKKEIKAKQAELSGLKVAKVFQTLNIGDINPGNIVTIKGLWGLDDNNMMKVERINVNTDKCVITLSGHGFKNVVATNWSKIEIQDNCSIDLCATESGVMPTVEVRTTAEWNAALDRIINNVNEMKC